MPTDANTAVESSPTDVAQDSGIDLESLSSEQYDHWMLKGELPEPTAPKTEGTPPSTANKAGTPPAKETDEPPEISGEAKGNQEAGKGKGIKGRVAQLDSELQELEARLARRADLKRQLESESGEKTGTPPAETKPAELKAPKRPNAADFNGPNAWEELEEAKLKYAEDIADYKAELRVQEDRKQRAEEATREKQQAETRSRADKWNKQVGEANKAHSDWDETIDPVMGLIRSPEFALGADFLVDSDVGAEVVYHLGSNLDEAKQIAAMSPTKQVAALAVIAHTLSKPAQSVKAPPGPKKVTETPPPPSELAGRNQLAPDPIAAALESGDTEAYMQLQNAKDIADIAAGKRRR